MLGILCVCYHQVELSVTDVVLSCYSMLGMLSVCHHQVELSVILSPLESILPDISDLVFLW